jgi:nucleoside-diphosphate-sugar epimerase
MRQPQKCLFALPTADLAEITRRSEKDLKELSGCRLFITGGTGFFGKWLVGALAYADAELELKSHLTILSRNPARFIAEYREAGHPMLEFQRGDVIDFSISPDSRYDFVLHGAADTTAISTPEQEAARERAIIDGTQRMIDLARECGARRLLNLSSGAVYGAEASKPSGAAEDDYAAAIPLTVYARAKRKAESLCAASQLDFVTARAFAFLGPHLPLDAHYAAGNFLRDAHGGGPIRVRGDGTALRSYLYPTDLVCWLLGLLIRGESGRAYNVGSDESASTADLARRVAATVPSQPEVVIESTQPQDLQNVYLPNIARARAELNLSLEVKLDEAIRRTLSWLNRPGTEQITCR